MNLKFSKTIRNSCFEHFWCFTLCCWFFRQSVLVYLFIAVVFLGIFLSWPVKGPDEPEHDSQGKTDMIIFPRVIFLVLLPFFLIYLFSLYVRHNLFHVVRAQSTAHRHGKGWIIDAKIKNMRWKTIIALVFFSLCKLMRSSICRKLSPSPEYMRIGLYGRETAFSHIVQEGRAFLQDILWWVIGFRKVFLPDFSEIVSCTL